MRASVSPAGALASVGEPSASRDEASCFLLREMGGRDVLHLGAACGERLTPASTFKIPHALAALDAGVLEGPGTLIPYDGAPRPFEAWRRDHTLATAMRASVVWYFQEVAERLGAGREQEYLNRFHYGNADPTSGLTTFWLGGSLRVSPEEQLDFLSRLYAGTLPVAPRALDVVKAILVQPRGSVVNALGEHPFAAPWSPDTVLSAKTGSAGNGDGREARWLVGHVRQSARSWIFVSCVVGGADTAPMAAVDLAARELRHAGVM